MSSATFYPHLSVADDSSVKIGATRYKVLHLATEHFHHGWSAEELLRQHPDLRPEQVYSALAYFYDNFAQMVEQIRATVNLADEYQTGATPLSRQDLLSRLAVKDR
jgi:uncharacterized protein (DUF433 family)